VRLRDLVDTSAAVAATPARGEKVRALAALLGQASPEDVRPAVAYLSGALTQRQIGIGWASLRDLPAPAAQPSLTVAEVDRALGAIGAMTGPGS
jgi:DNA ligase 1